MRYASGALLGLSVSLLSLHAVGAQSAPLPAPTPIVVPTLPPSDGVTQALVRAAAGILSDIIARDRLAARNTTHGTVSYFRRFELQVQTGPNAYRDVHLRPGTVIDPRGATPAAGSTVDVSGTGRPDGSLDADTIVVLH